MVFYRTMRLWPRRTQSKWRPLEARARADQMLLRAASRRCICMDRFVRGLNDGLRVAAGLGETLVGRPLAALLVRKLVPSAVTGLHHRQVHYTNPSKFKMSIPMASWHISPPVPPTADIETKKPPSEQLRSVMRLLAQSVVVCTADHNGAPRAMTMSSFTSLTLAPTPVITFNVATPSRTLDAIASSREFNIHILSGDASGAAVADHFTRGNMVDDVFQGLEDVAVLNDNSKPQAPVLQGDGVLHVLKCRVLDDAPFQGFMKIRDHVIIAGEVVEMAHGNNAKEFSLAYADRKYRQVGAVITNE